MFVYVQDIKGNPLMPTKRCGFVRRLLRDGRARVVQHEPFTIQLLYKTTSVVQNIDLGIDAGYRHVGVSACTDKEELYAAEVELRSNITDLLSTRRELRRDRRHRKIRYRKVRFLNRVRSKHKGWLPPSTENRINAHLQIVKNICQLLPVSHITVEVASFDIQKLKADLAGLPAPQGEDYQNGDQKGFWSVREYVLFRDGHVCQCCKGKSKDPILNVHHIESRKTGGNAPNNLVTLCETCHKNYHKGIVQLPKTIMRGKSFREATFMGVMRWAFYDRLKEIYSQEVSLTYGYLTKNTRIRHSLVKTHAIDARCISGHPDVEPLGYVYMQKKVRCHNRQLHKAKFLKGGRRQRNQAPKEVFGFRLFDKVAYQGTECFIYGRRSSGYFDIRLLNGTKLWSNASYKRLRLLHHSGSTLIERRLV